MAEVKDVAFYYPGHLWHRTDWIKNLLLFFDGVGLLVPEYKLGEPELVDPVLASPLRDEGLLHYLVADEVVDKDATEKLAEALADAITSGAFDSLSAEGTAFHEISKSRMGYAGDAGLANMLFEELKERGLARDSEDGVSVPLHPAIRYFILVLLAQILRPKGRSLGMDLSPITDRFRVVKALSEFLNLPNSPSAGKVVALDLQSVSVDLSSVPLDEVLAFRKENLTEHRGYMRLVRKFARELSLLPEADRILALNDRQSELADLASDLRTRSQAAWRTPASFAVGLTGAAWTAVTGDVLGALLGGAGAWLGLSGQPTEAGAFSYLFAAHDRYA